MAELVAFTDYRTEEISIDGEANTVRFSKQRDGEGYMLTAVGPTSGKVRKVSYTAEVAQDFMHQRGTKLEEAIQEILREK